MTPRQLCEWASESIPSVSFEYCSTEDYHREQVCLEERFQHARTIPGTRKLHSFVPVSQNTLIAKVFSSSTDSKEERVSSLDTELRLEDISGFVTCHYDGQWWLACVLQLDADNSEAKVTILHPHGPSRSFRYPSEPDVPYITNLRHPL